MTVAQLLEYLSSKLAHNQVKPDYKVAIWVKEGSGMKAVDIEYPQEIDDNLHFVSFRLNQY